MRAILRQLLVHLEPGPLRSNSATWGPNTRAAVREAIALRWLERHGDALSLTPHGRRALEGERRWDDLRQNRPSAADSKAFRTRAWTKLRTSAWPQTLDAAPVDWAA